MRMSTNAMAYGRPFAARLAHHLHAFLALVAESISKLGRAATAARLAEQVCFQHRERVLRRILGLRPKTLRKSWWIAALSSMISMRLLHERARVLDMGGRPPGCRAARE